MNAFRIVLVDDHDLLRKCIRTFISAGKDLRVLAEAEDGLALLRLLESCETTPEMIILDLSMPHMGGLEAARLVSKKWPIIKMLILTVHKERALVDEAIAAGAAGYLLKEDAAEHLLSAIETIRAGRVYLPSFYTAELPPMALGSSA